MKRKKLLFIALLPLLINAQNKDEFKAPSLQYGPYVWWHWAGPNFSKEGITKDLEAMKETGIGGATIFNISSAVQETHAPMKNNPWPQNTYRSTFYWDAIRHASWEASRLGMEIGLHNTVGYSTTGGPWINQENGMQCLVMTQTSIEGGKTIKLNLKQGIPPEYKGWGTFGIRATKYKDIAVLAVPEFQNSISSNDIINITSFMENDCLTWDAPKGKWKIFRLGYAPTMSNPHPVPDDLMNKVFEVDKLSKQHNIYHWNKVLNPLKENLGYFLGKSFKHILIDSYEAGDQSWTEGFEKEFIKLKKYDPLPWLTGCIGTDEEKKRFEHDYRDVISTMYYKNGFKTGRDLIHNYGMELQFEPYGGPFNTIECTTLADIPMGEFWTNSSGYIQEYVVSSARASGKKIIGAEAFTSRPENSAWTEDPAMLKYSADGAFCSGVNRLILHHWVHQPFDDRYQPGLSMGWWGTHFNRHQTWFEPGKAFFKYITRIQYMLQQGEEDIEYLCLDKIYGRSDVIASKELIQMNIKVKNKKIILPSGRTYSLLICPTLETTEPEVLKKLISLSRKGAVIIGKRPIKSLSLKGYPECDEQTRELGRKLKLYKSIEEAEQVISTKKFYSISAPSDKVNTLSRTTKEGKFIFLANRSNKVQRFNLTANINGITPEIWDPETGNTSIAKNWEFTSSKQTYMKITLKPNQTLFVVFHKKTNKNDILYGLSKEKTLFLDNAIKLRGTWDVTFIPKIGNKFNMKFDQLSDFKYSTDKRVMYFAGTAIYQKNIMLSKDDIKVPQIIMSLGEMNDIAQVIINGKDVGVWWYPPYKKDITQFLKEGKNNICIKVTTNWANCLIGDEQFPADFEWGNDRGKLGRGIQAYPQWFINKQERPSNRKAFVIWYYHNIDTPLQPAGLVGPVELLKYTE